MSEENNFITGSDSFEQYSKSQSIYSDNVSKASVTDRTFINTDTNMSVRSEFYRGDYDYYRKSEAVPRDILGRIKLALNLYKDNGILHNVIDLMADFASQGIRFQHPIPIINRFYKTYYDKVGVKERSERFVNYLLKGGNVTILKSYTKLKAKDEKEFKRAIASDLEFNRRETSYREIPIRYTLFLPTEIEVIGGELGNFVGQPIYGIKVSGAQIKADLARAGSQSEEYIEYLANQIPEEIKALIDKDTKYIVPNQSKIKTYHYKKDDTEIWAEPLASPVLSDLMQLAKYKLADIAALDGAMSSVRLWTVGFIGDSPQTSIFPSPGMINRIRNILANNIGGGAIDMVFGPEVSFKESNSNVWQWLGPDKYIAVLAAINDGLGIPPSMRSSGGTNSSVGNYVGLNTLIKRLQYVRDVLVSFWKEELKEIHDAMGFPGKPPEIVFDFMVFADEAAEKQLWINLWERNIVPTETIQEVFGRYPAFEKNRIKKEFSEMERGAMPDKASPFHNAEKDYELKKIILQGGTVAPSQVGVELLPKKPGEDVPMEKEAKLMPKPAATGFPSKKGKKKAGKGRPKNVTETKKRKPKPKTKPSTKASLNVWLKTAYDKISDVVTKEMLKTFNKTNARKLTTEEVEQLEKEKFGVLTSVRVYGELNEDGIKALIGKNHTISSRLINMIEEGKKLLMTMTNRELTQDEYRNLLVTTYSLYLDEDENE